MSSSSRSKSPGSRPTPPGFLTKIEAHRRLRPQISYTTFKRLLSERLVPGTAKILGVIYVEEAAWNAAEPGWITAALAEHERIQKKWKKPHVACTASSGEDSKRALPADVPSIARFGDLEIVFEGGAPIGVVSRKATFALQKRVYYAVAHATAFGTPAVRLTAFDGNRICVLSWEN